jgi:hypothetical protein
LKVYGVFIVPIVFALLSLMNATVAITLLSSKRYKSARGFTFYSMLFLIISVSFYAVVKGLIELINPDLLENDTILFAMFFNNVLFIVSFLAASSASLGAILSYIIKPSKKENKEIETPEKKE